MTAHNTMPVIKRTECDAETHDFRRDRRLTGVCALGGTF